MGWISGRSTSCFGAEKIVSEFLQSKGHILVVAGSCNIDVEFYASCHPVTLKCFVLGLLNINDSKVYASVKQSTKQV